MKTCTKCGKEYPATPEYFYRNKSRKDKLRSDCKGCSAAMAKKYKQSPAGKSASRESLRKYRNTISGHLHCTFDNIKRRCNNPDCKDYKHYGGRGIKNKFRSCNDFRDYVINELLIDPRGLDIDRIDNNGNYEPGNIRFVTRAENNRNRKR